MRKSTIALAVVLSSLASSVFAQATEISGPVTVFYAVSGSILDLRKCTFFQVNNVPAWYAVPFSDPGYEGELLLINNSFTFGKTLNFAAAPATSSCGSGYTAFDIYLGSPAAQ